MWYECLGHGKVYVRYWICMHVSVRLSGDINAQCCEWCRVHKSTHFDHGDIVDISISSCAQLSNITGKNVSLLVQKVHNILLHKTLSRHCTKSIWRIFEYYHHVAWDLALLLLEWFLSSIHHVCSPWLFTMSANTDEEIIMGPLINKKKKITLDSSRKTRCWQNPIDGRHSEACDIQS